LEHVGKCATKSVPLAFDPGKDAKNRKDHGMSLAIRKRLARACGS
jgi:hypothetical protein